MIRADKLICDNSPFSRSEAKKLFKNHLITANGVEICSGDIKVADDAEIKIDGNALVTRRHIYLMLNKPKGFVSSTRQKGVRTVLELVPDEFLKRGIFPAGRLDRDTTGFMLLTDDGDFAHKILSPKNHVEKVYIAELDSPITVEMINGFENGVILADNSICLKAGLTDISENGKYLAKISLNEGMYHQIKRMFGVFGAGVNELSRISIGGVMLDENLPEGSCRELTADELLLILQSAVSSGYEASR